MPPLGGYTMGMIRRSLAFPPRARNKAAGGRAKGEGDRRGTRAAAPPRPRLPVRGPGTAGMGAGSLKSSDSGRLGRAPGHPPGQVQPRGGGERTRPPPVPSLPRRKRLPRTGRVRTLPGFGRRCPGTRN